MCKKQHKFSDTVRASKNMRCIPVAQPQWQRVHIGSEAVVQAHERTSLAMWLHEVRRGNVESNTIITYLSCYYILELILESSQVLHKASYGKSQRNK